MDRKHWLTRQEFIEEWAVAQVRPGPNVGNLALRIGARSFGWAGAIAALGGLLTLPAILALLLALIYSRFSAHPQVAGALRGMAAVVAGLLSATALKLAAALKANALGIVVCLALGLTCFIAVALLRWPTTYMLLGLGGVGFLLAWARLKP